MSAIQFWEHVRVGDTPDACWRWEGEVGRKGYGFIQIKLDGENTITGAHRLGYLLNRGPIADGLVLDHLCRNPGCVNPAHLEPVTQRENVLRGMRARIGRSRRVACKRGHVYPAGKHQCRECQAVAQARYLARKRLVAAVTA